MVVHSSLVSFFFFLSLFFSSVASYLFHEGSGSLFPLFFSFMVSPCSKRTFSFWSGLEPSIVPDEIRKKGEISCLSFSLFVLTSLIFRDSQGQLVNWYPVDFAKTEKFFFLRKANSDIANFCWSSCDMCPVDPLEKFLMRTKKEWIGLEFRPIFLFPIMVRMEEPEHGL